MPCSSDLLLIARAQALFVSPLSAHVLSSAADVAEAIRAAVHSHGGVRRCAGEVAAAYGTRPELAAERMRWALRTVRGLYPPRGRREGRAPSAARRCQAPARRAVASPCG
ncbi:hypothetical protein ACFFMN_41435 [Planobispora siamensis]|uniref:Uncharacterized protein n=1 Tax=Planobispora siamensis TaxID=936338 RepID=A0A8J3SRT6_9ACTN|nr:hypothetical protein [Planobispora siamensis]GIH97701.1 hypothetical protein Psi01_83310 [Planobispora siamensis]